MANDAAAYAAMTHRAPSDEEELEELLVQGLPAGVWPAELEKVTRRTSADEETGEVKVLLGWHWLVELEDHVAPYRQTTSTSTGPKSTVGRILAAIAPEMATPGAAIRPAELKGRRAMLSVEIVEGASRVVSITPARKVAKA
jgi:hypothetical protein